MDQELIDIALELHRVGAFKDKSSSPQGRGFRLKLHDRDPHAPLSPFYLNLRTPENPKPGPLTPPLVQKIGRALFGRTRQLRLCFQHIAGLPHAGTPIAEALARQSAMYGDHPSLLVLDKQELQGKRQIKGILKGAFASNEQVLLIDDLITEADSKYEAITAMKEQRLAVQHILVVVDREQGGSQRLFHDGYFVNALFTLRGLLALYLEHGLISPEIWCETIAYLYPSK